MTRWLIVADDLTGAGDSAVAFTACGSVAIAVAPDGAPPDADVVAVDTDSRYAPPDVAARRVAEAVSRGGDARVLKKIDSLLRGNVAAEVRAAAGALGGVERPALAVVAAAFPATGRTTRDGLVRLPGRPPAGDIAALLAGAGLTADRAGLAEVRGTGLTARFAQAYAGGLDAVVCDGETDTDLTAVAEAVRRATHPVLPVGTGGLARALSGVRAEAARRAPGPALAVIGSHADEARAQRRALLGDGWVPLTLPTGGSAVRRALDGGRVVLSPDPDVPVVRDGAPRVAGELAAAAAGAADGLGVLAVTGGETARAVLAALGVTEIRVAGELEPGVVAGRLPGHDTQFVTKAGAFGDPGTLVRVLGPR